jgi:hypothetical protein
MLDDPDAQIEEWTEEVFADTLAEAERQCDYIAKTTAEDGKTLVTLTGKPQRKGRTSRKWVCYFRSEIR